MSDTRKISLVVPVYNEQDNLPALIAEVAAAMAPLGLDYECLLVDDGSADGSLAVIKELAAKDPRIKFISFVENRGQYAAFAAGFQHADIPAMLQVYDQGYDMVIGWRAKRQDSLAKKLASKFANAVRNKISMETVRDTGCSLKVMRAEMARRLPMYTGMHRFFPTLMKMQGARVAEVKVNHRPRLHGRSKYGVLDRALTTWYDLLAVRWMKLRRFEYRIKERN